MSLRQASCGVLGDVDLTGHRGDVRGLVILVCGSFLCIGPGLGDHVDYFLQVLTAVFFELVRLVLDGVG